MAIERVPDDIATLGPVTWDLVVLVVVPLAVTVVRKVVKGLTQEAALECLRGRTGARSECCHGRSTGFCSIATLAHHITLWRILSKPAHCITGPRTYPLMRRTLVQIDQVRPVAWARGPGNLGPTDSIRKSHWRRGAAGTETDEGTLLKLIAAIPTPGYEL